MKHFGIAFGVIIATAIGGAVVFDRYESHKTLAIPQPAAQAQTQAPTQANAASEEGSSASTAPTQIAQAEQPAVGKVEPAPVARTETTTKKAPMIATSTRPARSTRSSSSTSVDTTTSTQDSATVTAPTPAPAPAPASPPPSTTNDQPASPPPSASTDSAASVTQQPPAAQ